MSFDFKESVVLPTENGLQDGQRVVRNQDCWKCVFRIPGRSKRRGKRGMNQADPLLKGY